MAEMDRKAFLAAMVDLLSNRSECKRLQPKEVYRRLCLDFPDVDSESLDHFGEYILKCVPAQSLKLSFPLDMVLRRTLFTGVIYVALKKNSAQTILAAIAKISAVLFVKCPRRILCMSPRDASKVLAYWTSRYGVEFLADSTVLSASAIAQQVAREIIAPFLKHEHFGALADAAWEKLKLTQDLLAIVDHFAASARDADEACQKAADLQSQEVTKQVVLCLRDRMITRPSCIASVLPLLLRWGLPSAGDARQHVSPGTLSHAQRQDRQDATVALLATVASDARAMSVCRAATVAALSRVLEQAMAEMRSSADVGTCLLRYEQILRASAQQAPKLLLAGGLIRSLVQHIEPKGARSSTRDLAMEILLDASVRHRETRGWLARVPSLVKWLCDCKHRCTVPPKDAVGSVARKPGADAAFDVQAALWLVAFSLPGVTVTGATVDLSASAVCTYPLERVKQLLLAHPLGAAELLEERALLSPILFFWRRLWSWRGFMAGWTGCRILATALRPVVKELTAQIRLAQPPALPEAATADKTEESAAAGDAGAGGKVEKEDTRLGKWQALQRVLKLISLLADSKVD